MSRKKDPAAPGEPATGPAPQPDPSLENTQLIVRGAQAGQNALAWVLLSQKVEFFLKSRFGGTRMPPGLEFEDLSSEVMLKILGDLGKYQDQGKGAFWGWVWRLTQNRLTDLWRKYDRDRAIGNVARGLDDAAEGGGAGGGVEQVADEANVSGTQALRILELQAAEQDCLQRLPKEMREVYRRRRVHEMRFKDISAAMGGINENTLRSLFKRAKDYVQECVRRKLDDLGRRTDVWRDDLTQA